MSSINIPANQRILSIVNCIHSGIIAVNKEGIITICNSAAQKMLETEENIIGMPISSFVPETKMLEVINTGEGHFGKRFYFKDKTFVVNRTPILDLGIVIGAVTVFQDVTDFEEISTELESFKKVNKELETIIESSYDGIIITDGDGNVIKINKALLRVTNLSKEDFLGKNTDRLQEDGVFSFEPVSKLARKGKEILTGLQKIKTGKEVMVTSTPILDENNNVTRVVTNVRDMSDIINLQEKLAQSREISNHLRTEFNKLLGDDLRSHEFISRNANMYKLLDLIRRVADTDVTILLQGESGVGKEVFAKLVNAWSKKKGAFLKVNCSALPSRLLESELFGYVKGAFTGANSDGKPGFFEMADGGTLFLDEIEDLPIELQGKFLRVLEDGEFTRLGGTKVIKVDVRLIAASNKDLAQMIKDKEFRQDLYYRLNVVPIVIPPLRERVEDIPLLIEYFLTKFNQKYSANKTVTAHLMKQFVDYLWPGNVRELKNIIERLVLTSSTNSINNMTLSEPDGEIQKENIEIDANENSNFIMMNKLRNGAPTIKKALELIEKEWLITALQEHKNSRQIGELWGISHPAVLKKLKKYGLTLSGN